MSAPSKQWVRKEIHRREGILARRRARMANIDERISRLRFRCENAVARAEERLAAAKTYAEKVGL